MKRRFFLTSLIVAGLIRPAMAETFPADGYMQEDKTYENAATYTNTGVYDGSVTATAEYTDNVYNILAGTYLPAGAETAAPCTAGSFCPGKTDATYDESAPQGIAACPTGYPNSEAGAGAENQCYTACTLATANIAHATGVSGNDYFGDGADTCAATDCDPGYHVEGGEFKIVNKTPVIPVDYTLSGHNNYAYIDADGKPMQREDGYGFPTLTAPYDSLKDSNTWATSFDYGILYGRASCQSYNPNELSDYVWNSLDLIINGEMTWDEFESDLTTKLGASKAKYVTNAYRRFVESLMAGDDEWPEDEEMDVADFLLKGYIPDLNFSTDSTGDNCYCQITGYTPTDGDFKSATNAPWVWVFTLSSEDACAEECAQRCAVSSISFESTRSDMLDAREAVESGGTCAANEIKINWTDADQADIDANDAGMCTFGGDIRTPVKAVAKKGKTFKGWKFEKAN